MSQPVRCLGLLVSLALVGFAHAQQVGDTYDKGSQVRIGQYSTQSTLPDQSASDPLSVFVQLHYPRQGVATIGEAVAYTLLRTGWTLGPNQPIEAQAFMRLPLPESQRTVGTFRVRDVLQVLVGSTWAWQEDPVQRRLWLGLSVEGKRQRDALLTEPIGGSVGATEGAIVGAIAPPPNWSPLAVGAAPSGDETRQQPGDQQ